MPPKTSSTSHPAPSVAVYTAYIASFLTYIILGMMYEQRVAECNDSHSADKHHDDDYNLSSCRHIDQYARRQSGRRQCRGRLKRDIEKTYTVGLEHTDKIYPEYKNKRIEQYCRKRYLNPVMRDDIPF